MGIRNIVTGTQINVPIDDHGGGTIFDPLDLGNGGTNPPDNDADSITSREATEAYQDYIAAYNKLTDLMSRGLGDTPEAQQAYKEYKEAKQEYEQIAKSLK